MGQKTIDTLVEDIGEVLCNPPEITDEQVAEFGSSLAAVVQQKLNREETKPALRMSNLGTKCLRKLWYTVNAPDKAEPLRPEVRLKFLYGDIIETLILWLAKVAGHDVRGEQDQLDIGGVKGHRDGIIDNVTVDVKSASSYSFNKFKEGLRPETDAFGYLDQLGSYEHAGEQGDTSAFVAVDKSLGHITVDKHKGLKDRRDYPKFVEERKAIVAQKEPPPRGFFSEPDGKSGNEKLGLECAYCAWKHECWPGVRTFIYSSGPRYLTRVAREPDVPEAK